MLKVAVFDDHQARREALEFLLSLQADMYCSGSFEDCRHVVDNLQDNPPDVVLMDIHMPHVDGLEGVRLVHRYFPTTGILIQTVFENDEKIVPCLRAGAHGCIVKGGSNERLLEAIHEVMNGPLPMTASIARLVLAYFGQRAKGDRERVALSKPEMEVLTELANGLPQKMIAARLSSSVQTVSHHLSRIYAKLHVAGASEAVVRASQRNMI